MVHIEEVITKFPELSPQMQQIILDGPSLTPPPGVVPNFVDPSNRNTMAISVASVCLALGCVAFGLRLYNRLLITKRTRLEDYLGIVAFLAYLGEGSAVFLHATKCGFYVHTWDIQYRQLYKCIQISIAFPTAYNALMMTAKPAIMLEWIHIFVPKGTRNLFFWQVVGVTASYTLFYVIGFFMEITQCVPLQKSWKPWLPGTCRYIRYLDVIAAYVNVVIDLVILLLPQSVIWKLHLSAKKKLELSVVFSIGILTLTCAAGRAVANMKLEYGGDLMYGIGPLYLWAWAESTCVILVFCVSSIPKVFSESSMGRKITTWFHSLLFAASSLRGRIGGRGEKRPRRQTPYITHGSSQIELTH